MAPDRATCARRSAEVEMAQSEKTREDRAYEMRTRGIALLVLGGIPTLIGVLSFPTWAEQQYSGLVTPALLIAGLALMAGGAALVDRARKLRDGR
jgi:hypothetical protein